MSTFIPSEIDLENTAILNVYINNINSEWKTWYQTHIDQHNENIKDIYPNAGFDLFTPNDLSFYGIRPDNKNPINKFKSYICNLGFPRVHKWDNPRIQWLRHYE